MERRVPLLSAARDRVAMLSRRRATDVVLVVALAAVAGVVGGVAVANSADGAFYQGEYGPAVMRACGNGYTQYTGSAEAVTDFLTLESRQLDCRDVDPARAGEPNVFATAHRYLLESVALLWRIDEVSWDALLPLFALFYALSAAALFGIFRLFVGRVLATLGTLMLIFSPLQLDMLRELRDYAKTPFLLAAFFLAGVFATRRFDLRAASLLGAFAGLVLGVGFGFRADVLVALPMLLVAVAVFWPERWRLSLAPRAAATAAIVTVFAAFALPVIMAFSSGGNLFLMGVHGQTKPFTEFLDLQQNLYGTGTLYLDPYAVALTNAHDLLVDGNVRELRMATADLDEASSARYEAVVRHLPADFFARADAAVLHALDAAPAALDRPVPATVDAIGVPGAVHDGVARLLGPLDDGWLVVLAALVVGAARSPRLAVAALLAVVYLGSLISFQPAVRHSFYLEFMWWVAAAYLAHELWGLARRLWLLRGSRADIVRSFSYRRPALGVAILVATVLATTVVPLVAARAYQSRHLGEILARLDDAPRVPVSTRDIRADGQTTLIAVPEAARVWRRAGGVRLGLFVARFNGRRCAYPQLRAVVRYESVTEYDDFTTGLEVRYPRRGDGRVRIYFLAFATSRTRFTGLELPRGARSCLEGLDAVTDTSELPVVVDATLGARWREATRYQSFAWEDRQSAAAGTPYVTSNPLATYSYAELASGSELAAGSTSFRAEGVHGHGTSGWRFAGRPDGRFTYLTVSAPVDLGAGKHVIVRGRVREGGVRIGLQLDGQWFLDVVADEQGEFWAVLRAPSDGRYQIVIANELSDHDDRQDVVVDEIRVA